MKTDVFIEGMTCQHCKMKVEQTLSNVAGVKKAKVNLDKGVATIKSKDAIDQNLLTDAIENIGYRITEIK